MAEIQTEPELIDYNNINESNSENVESDNESESNARSRAFKNYLLHGMYVVLITTISMFMLNLHNKNNTYILFCSLLSSINGFIYGNAIFACSQYENETNNQPEIENDSENENVSENETVHQSKLETVPDTEMYLITIDGVPKYYEKTADDAVHKITEIINNFMLCHPDWNYYAEQVSENTYRIMRQYKWFIMNHTSIGSIIKYEKISQVKFL